MALEKIEVIVSSTNDQQSKKRPMYYAGIDLHRSNIVVSFEDRDGLVDKPRRFACFEPKVIRWNSVRMGIKCLHAQHRRGFRGSTLTHVGMGVPKVFSLHGILFRGKL